MALTERATASDTLVMTATPIPRTLMLTAYGDLDVSRLTEKPAGRQPIEPAPAARAARRGGRRRRRAVTAARRSIGSARWSRNPRTPISPPPRSAIALLSARFPATRRAGARPDESAETDRDDGGFAGDAIDLLVATTVVEVGVDVPQATIMVIEHAERFGLAQLHQLRGRIGRGASASRAACCSTPAARRDRARRGSRSCARPRTASASPRKICGCAAPAKCSARARAACPTCGSPTRRCMTSCCRWHMTMPGSSSTATRTAVASAARRSAPCSICSGATMRCVPACGLTQICSRSFNGARHSSFRPAKTPTREGMKPVCTVLPDRERLARSCLYGASETLAVRQEHEHALLIGGMLR